MHISSAKLVIVDSSNGLLPIPCQVITWVITVLLDKTFVQKLAWWLFVAVFAHGLTSITALISNHMPSKVRDEITYPFLTWIWLLSVLGFLDKIILFIIWLNFRCRSRVICVKEIVTVLKKICDYHLETILFKVQFRSDYREIIT